MGRTEQIMFNEKVSRPYSYSKKYDVEYFCGGREKVGKSNNFKNELTLFTP
jgi:hypothetical protein